jgi:hypothetical protein
MREPLAEGYLGLGSDVGPHTPRAAEDAMDSPCAEGAAALAAGVSGTPIVVAIT